MLQFIGSDDALLQILRGSGVSVAWTSRRRTVAIAPQRHRAERARRATADAASVRGRSFPLSKRLPSARAPPGHYRRPLRYCVARPSRPITASMSSTTAQATTAIACASGSDMSTTGERLHSGTWTLLGDPRSRGWTHRDDTTENQQCLAESNEAARSCDDHATGFLPRSQRALTRRRQAVRRERGSVRPTRGEAVGVTVERRWSGRLPRRIDHRDRFALSESRAH